MTIWQEARGESYEGKVAVAEVIRNRMVHKYSSDGTVEGTVLRPWQFSGWNTDDLGNRIPSARIELEAAAVEDCAQAWHAALAGSNLTKGALLYLNPGAVKKLPGWLAESTFLVKIGEHDFYLPPTKKPN
jgi:N-acetylmuramoyl-L-alanine amidase